MENLNILLTVVSIFQTIVLVYMLVYVDRKERKLSKYVSGLEQDITFTFGEIREQQLIKSVCASNGLTVIKDGEKFKVAPKTEVRK